MKSKVSGLDAPHLNFVNFGNSSQKILEKYYSIGLFTAHNIHFSTGDATGLGQPQAPREPRCPGFLKFAVLTTWNWCEDLALDKFLVKHLSSL